MASSYSAVKESIKITLTKRKFVALAFYENIPSDRFGQPGVSDDHEWSGGLISSFLDYSGSRSAINFAHIGAKEFDSMEEADKFLLSQAGVVFAEGSKLTCVTVVFA